ncbi:hypothetical protein FGL86_11680 [Pistricoccus aurantiacus]|uniref:Uncharacterized protein n=1 Tax=Pistricoccus aurantiacus TaxID=1883414 RepID=A0A5B8SXV4_9GAMM|nr:hypothetical protein [Pistricoccus aurantiacus]QEA39663.1 hypothetical protein FGL86_11680 [Pistricoccus aurantiacus]
MRRIARIADHGDTFAGHYRITHLDGNTNTVLVQMRKSILQPATANNEVVARRVLWIPFGRASASENTVVQKIRIIRKMLMVKARRSIRVGNENPLQVNNLSACLAIRVAL